MISKLKNTISSTEVGQPSTADGDTESNRGIVDDINDATTFSWETRIQGFLASFIVGMVCSILGGILLMYGKITGFTILFSIGTILSMLSTLFLTGPLQQLKKMFAPTRAIATIIVIVSIVLTLVAGLVLKKALLAFVFVLIQYAAFIWYSISYIPYARDAVSKCICSCIGN